MTWTIRARRATTVADLDDAVRARSPGSPRSPLREHAAIARQDIGYALRVLAGSAASRSRRCCRWHSASAPPPPPSVWWTCCFSTRCRLPTEDRLVAVYTVDQRNTGFNPTSYPNFLDYQRGVRGFAGADGVHLYAAERVHGRRAATGPRRHRRGQLLQCAGRHGRTWPRARPVRRARRGPAAGRRPFGWLLDAAVRREPGDCRPDDPAERHALHGDRRDAARVHRHRHRPSRRSLGAAFGACRVRARYARPAHGAAAAPVRGDRPAGTRHVDRRGPVGRRGARRQPRSASIPKPTGIARFT